MLSLWITALRSDEALLSRPHEGRAEWQCPFWPVCFPSSLIIHLFPTVWSSTRLPCSLLHPDWPPSCPVTGLCWVSFRDILNPLCSVNTTSSSVTQRLQVSSQLENVHNLSRRLHLVPLGTHILQKTFPTWSFLFTCCLPSPSVPALSPSCILTQSHASTLVLKREWRFLQGIASCCCISPSWFQDNTAGTGAVPDICGTRGLAASNEAVLPQHIHQCWVVSWVYPAWDVWFTVPEGLL